MQHFSAQATATRLGISKQYLLVCARKGIVKPTPVRLEGNRFAPWLFSATAKIVVDKRK